jgi:hypothetical protein
MSNITDYQANLWLAQIQSVWVGLNSSNPNINGDLETEIQGGGYRRISASFTEPDQGLMWNESGLIFSGMPASTVAFITGWNKQFNGKMLWYCEAVEPERVQTGQKYVVKAGTIAVSLA